MRNFCVGGVGIDVAGSGFPLRQMGWQCEALVGRSPTHNNLAINGRKERALSGAKSARKITWEVVLWDDFRGWEKCWGHVFQPRPLTAPARTRWGGGASLLAKRII